MFVHDDGRIQVFRVSDGAHVRTMCSEGSGPGQLAANWGGVAFDGQGNVVVADYANNRVQVLRTSDGAHVRTITSGAWGNGNDQLDNPSAVCLSADGVLLYIVDYSNHRVQVFCAADGDYVRTIGSSSGQGSGDHAFHCPYGACVSPCGEWLFVSDQFNHRVKVLRAANGAFVRTIGSGEGSGAGMFNGPRGLCVSPDGELLYVADTNKYRVQVVRTSDGALLRSIALDGFFLPSFVCLSRDGTALFVSDAVRDAVVLI
jgi:DNA-binding beta-propeller fold protein YncE